MYFGLCIRYIGIALHSAEDRFQSAMHVLPALHGRYTEPLALKQVLDVPKLNEHRDRSGRLMLPNEVFGSDHFSLVSEFYFPDAKNGNEKAPP